MNRRSERGVALLVVLLAMLVISAIGAGLVLATISETMIAANGRGARDAFYAAEAAVERALADVGTTADWNQILNGSALSTMVDGLPGGTRQPGSGVSVDLDQQLNLANCGKPTACTAAEVTAATTARPWGANNPWWRLYAYGPLAGIAAGAESDFYVLVFAADDPAETDGNPFVDAPEATEPGHGVLLLRGLAFGPRGAHCTVQLTAARAGFSVRVTNWTSW